MSTTATIWPNVRPRAERDVGPILTRFVGLLRKWRAARRAQRELHALDDRTLKDIGISRWEICGVFGEMQTSSGPRPLLF